jgi:hypothetical protein
LYESRRKKSFENEIWAQISGVVAIYTRGKFVPCRLQHQVGFIVGKRERKEGRKKESRGERREAWREVLKSMDYHYEGQR